MKLCIFVLLLVTLIRVNGETVQPTEKIKEEKEEEAIFLSCDHVRKENSSSSSGAYYLSDGRGGKSPVYCYFEDIEGCGDGPWTLQMKLDGNKRTFNYDSYRWRSTTPYQPEMAKTGFERNETKTIAFSTVKFTKLCLGMKVGEGDINWISLDHLSSNLYSVFGRSYQKTNIGREKWKSLIPGSSLQPNCNKEGFNVYNYGAKARIGIISNQEDNCNSPDSRLGFGTGGRHCGQHDSNSVGNEATCESDNGDKHIRAFGYIFSKDESFNNRIGIFTADEEMRMYLDGKLAGSFEVPSVANNIIIPFTTKIIAIRAENKKVVGGGILGSTTLDETTSSEWKCSNKFEEGWTLPTFDDSHWPYAVEYGSNYYPPSPLPRRVENIDRYAKWIWTAERVVSHKVYCRVTLEDHFGCPVGWEFYHGSCYKKSKSCRGQQDALKQCKKIKSDLVSIHSEGENQFVNNYVGYKKVWIGLFDKTTENVFNWTDNTPVDYTKWFPGEPNDWGSGEDCVHLLERNSKWNDIKCYTCLNYVCKKVLHGCEVRNGDCSHGCANTTGSYKCTCPYPGQVLGKDEHTCEATGMDVKITNQSLSLSIPASPDSTTSFEVRLRDEACKAEKKGSMYILKTSLDDCGTTIVKTYAAKVYSNSVFIKPQSPKRNTENTVGKTIKVPFYCFVSENGTNCVIPYQAHLGSVNYRDKKYGFYSVGMTLYDSKSFHTPYTPDDYPVQVGFYGRIVYFQLRVTTQDKFLTLMPNNCYLSPSQDFEDPRKYYFIEEGCYTDNSLTYYSSPSDSNRLSVRVNHFRLDSPYAYIHCKVLVCLARDKNSRCGRGCMKDSQKSVTGDKGTEKELSAGPIIFTYRAKKIKPNRKVNKKTSAQKKAARKGKRSDSSGNLAISYANIVILALLCCIALVAVVYFLKKKYRKKIQSKPGTYFNLSDKIGDASL